MQTQPIKQICMVKGNNKNHQALDTDKRETNSMQVGKNECGDVILLAN